jgi:hypothetical protein
MRNIVAIILLSSLASCKPTNNDRHKSNISDSFGGSLDLRSMPVANFESVDFNCSDFLKPYKGASSLLLQKLTDELITKNSQIFPGKKYTICSVAEVSSPADANSYYANSIFSKINDNSYFDIRSGFLAIGPGLIKKFEGDLNLLKANIAHELGHFVGDHWNMYSPTSPSAVKSLRKSLKERYKIYVPAAYNYIQIAKNESSYDPDKLPPEIEKQLKVFGGLAEKTQEMERLEKKLRTMAMKRYSEQAVRKLKSYNFIIELEADQIGQKIYINAGGTRSSYQQQLKKTLFIDRNDWPTCQEIIESGREPPLSDPSVRQPQSYSHPNPCWRLWRLKTI